ncbi:MAG: tetratricopeptide repeat protein [Myxococcota bacterium]
MALNKRKVLDSARKLAQKGAKAKALKEYQLLLQADPRDAKLLLEVGDCYRRWGQVEDAIAQYAKVAQQYRQDGFDARAVAVYKQILNLDPKHYSAYVSLSELYQRMGLDAEAIGALQTAADGYHREGRKTDALELLRQMAALDPTNVTSRLKVAELLRQEKMTAEALAEFEAAARELENQQEREQLIAVRERILELKPDHVGALCGMVRSLMVAGQLDRAEPFALRAVEASGDPAQYELLIELFAQMGNDAKLAEATRGLAKVHRDRGDEDKARELMQRLPVDEVGARSRLAVDVSEVDEPEIADEELLEGDPFLTVPGRQAAPSLDLGGEELELEEEDEIQLDTPAKATSTPPPPLEGDADQLLAEASVYLRYGKRAQAIASLRAILDQDPDHRAALEKLGEAYVDDGQPAEAVQLWLRAGALIRKAGDAKALVVLRDRIAAIDPKAAAGLEPIAPSAPSSSAPPRPAASDATEELDLDLEMELDAAVTAGDDDPAKTGDAPADAMEAGFEFEVDASGLDLAEHDVAEEEEEDVAADASDASLSLSEDGSFEFEIDPDEISSEGVESAADATDGGFGALELDLDGPAALADDRSAESAPPGSTTTMARIQEELEEAEFYVAQQMFDEAESILARILEIAPNHPSAMLRMGEIQVARGAAPEATPAPAEVKTKAGRRVAGTSERDLGSTARFEDGLDLSSPFEEGDGEGGAPDEVDEASSGFEIDVDVDGDVTTPEALALDEDAESASGLDLAEAGSISIDADAGMEADAGDPDSEQDADGDATGATARLDASRSAVAPSPSPSPSPSPETHREPIGTVVLPRPAPSPVTPPPPANPPAPIAAPALAASAAAGDTFDLREALADVFDDDSGDAARPRTSSEVLSTVEDGFESIFSDFKKGVSETLGEGDYDTRYDLGIAYREMGLFEDAIGEFKICLESPRRRFDSLFLMGLCARDLERHADAVHHLEQALALPDLPEDRLAGVFFELSIAQSLAGDRERARANLRRVIELDPDFPGAAEKLAAFESSAEGATASTGSPSDSSGFESFDDLFDDEAGEGAEGAAAPVESFESFDDVVSDVDVASKGPGDASAGRASRSEGPADPNGQSGRKGPRKKISFV